MVKKPAPEVDEAKILFPEEQVGPYVLKPWTLAQLGQALPTLIGLLGAFIASGKEVENLQDFTSAEAMELVPVAAPFFPELIAITLRLPREEVAALGNGMILALGLKIQNQNAAEIKNFFAGFFATQKIPAKSNPTTP